MMPMPEPISIDEVNVLTPVEFRQRFGNIIECCPDVAAALSSQRPFINVESMALAANRFLDQLQPQGKERVLLLHPDLAGRLAEQGQLTHESSREQKSAGLDSLSPADKTRINELNKRQPVITASL
ncbi:2-oxo-4-hydroxy-4-carboxy-5-ureidoimidazoline decarboxylase isoform X2 [Anabrus simplex]|uniref:2-oxo-4-hydroxy-4-carboxy-5-ureidoimidazoline decarboxylase isoform X2 n=1 Tax=Anabrus simplex TaxID=316456 RepID=UPI0035A3773B